MGIDRDHVRWQMSMRLYSAHAASDGHRVTEIDVRGRMNAFRLCTVSSQAHYTHVRLDEVPFEVSCDLGHRRVVSVIAFALEPSWVTDYLRSEYISRVWILLLHDSQQVTKREKAKGGQLAPATVLRRTISWVRRR